MENTATEREGGKERKSESDRIDQPTNQKEGKRKNDEYGVRGK